MIDAVLSYHTNSYTCGVAKFNQRLARELRVPCAGLTDFRGSRHPLVSVKHAEIQLYQIDTPWPSFDVFLHDWVGGPLVTRWLQRPERVYAANETIADAVRPTRPDVITAWCPSTVEGDASRGDIHVLTFGMAHKLALPHYEKLKSLLDDTPGTYTVGLSCAVHEGNPWDKAMHDAEDSLRRLFGLHLRVLGYLADDALVREMDAATAVAAFYDPAFRANNTSAWAVLEWGTTLITNLDAASPASSALDIGVLSQFPSVLTRVRVVPTTVPDWPQLTQLIQDAVCAK